MTEMGRLRASNIPRLARWSVRAASGQEQTLGGGGILTLTPNIWAAARGGQYWHGVREVSAVHHINPLKTGLFPTASLPRFIRHSPLNLRLLTLKEHIVAHRNLVWYEKYLTSIFNPVTTAGRAVYVSMNSCDCR